MVIKLREANINDLNSIRLLNKKLFLEEFERYDKTINCEWPLSEEGNNFYTERILGPNGCAFVLIENEKIIGYLVGSLSKDEFYRCINNFAELDDMFILPEYRNKGYGGMLYEEFIRWCKSKNVKCLKVLVTAKNKEAIQFYKKKGFEDHNVTLEKDL